MISERPLITVLMPVYNGAQFLAEAIDSILQQTFTNFEFLIIDDGSSDNSAAIVTSYNDSRIRFIQNKKNLGISATLNKGIELASAELIARMDADDISYAERLDKQFRHLQENKNCALVSSWAREISQDKEVLYTEEFNSRYYYYMLNFQCWIYHPTVMYRKAAAIDCGGYSERYSEDYDLWWKIARNWEMANLPEVLLDYRSTEISLSRVAHKEEYEVGHRKQILRNIHHYTGSGFKLSDEEIECLRYNCEPILNRGSIQEIITFFKKFIYINRCIFKVDKHKDIGSIKEAAAFQMKVLLQWFSFKLTRTQMIRLLFHLRQWNELRQYSFDYFSGTVMRRLKSERENYHPAESV